MGADPLTQGKAMYVAPDSDKEWLLNAQRKLYTLSWEGWQPKLNFVETSMESPVHIERCTPGLVKGAPQTAE